MVAEKIADSSTSLDIFQDTMNKNEKLDLLVSVCKELAKQHQEGVLQRDLHLGNFLLGGDKVFALDSGQMRFLSHPVAREMCISQLASLARYLPTSDTESITRLREEYAHARGWRFRKSDETLFQKQLIVHRKRGSRKGLKKCLRTSKRQLRIKTDRHLAVFNKDFCEGAEPIDFIERIDAMMDKGQILKNGNTCYVSRITWNGKDVVIKRYNNKGLIHSLRHTIKRSRARRGWLHAHRLGMLNIATPKPVAYIEQRRGILVWKSYFVTEYVHGRSLYNFLQDNNVTEQQRSEVTEQIMELFEKLGKYRISHGDLKHSNILITENGPTIIDLDAMTVHRWGLLYKRNRAKDMAHFPRKTSISTLLR